MAQRAERAVLVVGVGRSGTSLAMQALQRLGVGLSGDLVPASETNARGTFEDVGIRKLMKVLGGHFGHFQGRARPEDWREDPLSQETERRLRDHLDKAAADCESPVLAVKFPLASAYLPIWRDACAVIGLPLDLVWATRNAQDTLASFVKAYDFTPAIIENRYLLRSLHLMEDLPLDAFLLPYEGWTSEPEAQIRALADFVGLPLTDEAAALDGLFDPLINHGGASEPFALDPLTRAVDTTVSGRRGRAADLFGPDLVILRALAGRINAAIAKGRSAAAPPSQEAELRQRLVEKDRRIKRIEAAAAKTEAELREAYAALTRARDADVLARADRETAVQAELLRLGERMQELEKARKDTEALAETKAVWARRTTKEKAAERKAAQAARKALKTEREAFETERKAARKAFEAEIAAIRASRRWRVGNAIVGAFARPLGVLGFRPGRGRKRRLETSMPRGTR